MRKTKAAKPPILQYIWRLIFQNLLNFPADLNIDVLSCVSKTALPVFGFTTRAIESKTWGYKTRLSALEPLRFPNGKSDIKTSTESSLKGIRVASH